jgi:DNA-binding NarL/FixJ family response regulator
VRVLLVDDHPVVREGLRSMLNGDGLEPVGEAGTGQEAVAAAVALGPDVILLDMELPDQDGLAVLRQLRERVPGTPVLIVSMHDDAGLVRRALEAGASGWLLKGVGRRELRAAVRAVRDGTSVLDQALLRALAVEPPATGATPLTPLEQDVLRLVAGGLTNRQIGEHMRWSLGTVKKYVQRILDKLGVADRTQAAVEAVRRGLLRPEGSAR